MSIISRHRDMDALVTEVFGMYRVKESTGAVLFGPDTGNWPARWYDAIRIAEIEEDRVDTARELIREMHR